jgi:TRAP-type mannitol/chloroaromatic compound transport system permease small subunit
VGADGPGRLLAKAADRLVAWLVAAGGLLVLPVSLLLFLQWPLREWIQAYSREANDLAQVFFALYVAIAVTAATRRGAHLAADAFARRLLHTPGRRAVRMLGAAVELAWALVVLYVAWPFVAQSVRQLEAFPETFNSGYFLVKGAVALLALLVALQAVVGSLRTAGAEIQ